MAKISSGDYAKHALAICGQDGSHTNILVNTSYDNAEFTVATATTDYDVDTNQSAAWNNITIARYFSLRTDQTVTVKFNATGNDAITVTSTDSPLVMTTLEITNCYITNNSGSTANIKILLT